MLVPECLLQGHEGKKNSANKGTQLEVLGCGSTHTASQQEQGLPENRRNKKGSS